MLDEKQKKKKPMGLNGGVIQMALEQTFLFKFSFSEV